MATNMNMARKPNLGLNDYSGLPVVSPGDYMAMGKDGSSSNFPIPLSNSQMSHNSESALMGPTNHNPYSTNHYGQVGNSFGLTPRQYENPLEMARQKFSPLPNSNMASGSPFSGPYAPANAGDNEPFPMARYPGKFRNQEMFNVNKGFDQVNYAQHTQRAVTSNPWVAEYSSRNQRVIPGKGPAHREQAIADPVNQNMNIEQTFASHGGSGPSQHPYPTQARYMTGDMYKQTHMNDQQFSGRGVGSNFHQQDYYPQEQMRQMANAQQYSPSQAPHPGNNFMANQGNSPAPFSQPVVPKPSQEPMFPQQFGSSPKPNGPLPMMNMHNTNMADGRQVPLHTSNFPVSPVGSQMPVKPSYGSALGMRGTVSPNVTIGLPKKHFQPQEEGVTSPSGNQNAAAAAAAAAVLAAINTANPHTSPQSTGDMHNVPSRPPSIHAKDPGSRSPATSISDHKSESGGSGINDMGTTPSPAKSLAQNSPQVSTSSSNAQFPSDVATGRVPSPSVNQLPNSDIEAMIHSVSNVPGNGISSTEHPSTTSQRSKRESKSALPKLNAGSTLSPVTPPSPFSLSPSIADFELDILSPSWEDPAGGSTTPVSKLYKISDEPKRKEFLDKLVLLMEQQGKNLEDVPNFNGETLDLYKFHKLVNGRGGFHEVIRMKLWKEVVQELTNSSEPDLVDSQNLRDHYMRLLLPFESKLNDSASLSAAATTFSPPVTTQVTSAVSSNAIFSSAPAAPSPSNSQLGNIDLSSMNYRNLPMFQSTASGSSFSPGLPNQANQPPAYPNTPSTPQPQPQNFSGTSAMPHQLPSYRNVSQPAPSLPGYPGHPPASSRVPGYPGSPSPNLGPGYPNQQIPGYAGPPSASQMPGYHNSLASQVPGYRGPSNAVPAEAMYLRDQHTDFARGSSHAMNKHYQHLPDSHSQHSSMFPNFPQQSQHPAGMMFPQQSSNYHSDYPLERQRIAQRSTGTASPKRIQQMQNQWGHKYSQGSPLTDPNFSTAAAAHSPFHPSQSAGHKIAGGPRLPPPYPYPKGGKSSPSPHPLPTNSSQTHTIKMGALGSLTRKDEVLFPAGCVESTKPVFTKKRRLTARDLGPVEAWKIMMSLKSGLLSETTWALDTLTILLCDDTTVGFFRLAHLPGLLDTIVEHYRRNLINVFGLLDHSEVATGVPKRFGYGKATTDENNTYTEKIPHLIAAENFSAVIVGDCLDDEEEDYFSSGSKDWTHGGGDTTIHIQTHFETDPGFYEGRFSKKGTESEIEENAMSSSCDNSATVDSTPDRNTTDEQPEWEALNHACSGNQGLAQVNGENGGDEKNSENLSNVSCKADIVYNGVPSPKQAKGKAKIIGDPSDIRVDLQGHGSDTEYDVKQKKCCNGDDGTVAERTDCSCSGTKLEPATEDSVKDRSNSLIKRLKTELDLDVDFLSEDSENDSTSGTSNLRTTGSREVECELKQEFPLSTLTWSQDSAIKCCICVSNIIRSLSFVPGNDVEMARHPSLLLILGKLFLLHHLQKRKGCHGSGDCQHNDRHCWWHDCLDVVRENALVTVANIAGYLDLSLLAEPVSYPLLDGLLHWLVCQSATAVDTFQANTGAMSLSPKHLALETLAKMSVLESNVDFILLSPDKRRLSKAYEYLVKLFSDKTNEVTREFSLVLLSSLTQYDESIPSSCSEKNLVTVLVGFLEDARERVEAMAARGFHPSLFREDDMRVSVGMVRRAASLLACIAKRTNSTHLIPFQERILTLTMSRLLDSEVQSYLSNVLYNLPR